MEEQWKAVKNYEGYYEVSNTGKVRSLVNRYNSKGVFELKGNLTNKGYYRVQLSVPVRAKKSIHRLVAEVFLEQNTNKPFVNHIDNNRTNNRVSNLEWCTQSENLQHAQDQGRLFEAQSKGGKVQGAKASERAHIEALNLVGTSVNSWEVLKYIGITGAANRETLLCRCKCDFEQNIEAHRLKSRKVTMCRACAKKEAREKSYQDLIHKYVLTELSTWKILNISEFNPDEPTKKVKFYAECKVCRSTTTIPQPSIIGNKPIKNCQSCKDISKMKI